MKVFGWSVGGVVVGDGGFSWFTSSVVTVKFNQMGMVIKATSTQSITLLLVSISSL